MKKINSTYVLEGLDEFDLKDGDDERELLKNAKNGNISSRNKLIESYLKLIIFVSKKYTTYGIDIEEFISEGTLAIIDAIDHYNFEMTTKFSAYVFCYIEMRIVNYIKYVKNTIKIPNNVQTEIFKLNNIYIDLKNKLKREPTEDEMIDSLKYTKEKYFKILEYKAILEKSISINDEGIGDIAITDNTQEINKKIAKENFFYKLSSILTDNELKVIKLKFGFEKEEETNLIEISKKLKMSSTRIRAIEKKALLKIKNSDIIEELKDCI